MASRFRLLPAVSAVAVLALTVTGCAKSSSQVQGGSGSAGAAKTVTVLISADTNIQSLWEKSLVPGFEAKNPGTQVKINFDLHGEHDTQNLAKLSAAKHGNSDPGFDVADAGFVSQAASSGLLEPYDASKVPALASVPKVLVDAGKGAGVPYRASSVLLAYNTKKVTSPPKTLNDLLQWIRTHDGRFAYNSPKSGGSGQAFVTTVLDANMDPAASEKLRTSYDKPAMQQWSKGFAVLHSLNPHVFGKGVYPNGNAQVLDLLSTGQIDMAPVWSDMFLTGQQTGQIPAEVKVTQISNPSLTGGGSYLGVPTTSQHKDLAAQLISYVLSPDAQASIATDIAGYPVIPLKQLPAAVQKRFATAKTDQLRPSYLADVSNDLNNQWDQQVPGQ